MEEKSVIRHRLWHSLEMNHYRTNLIIFTVFIPLFCVYARLRNDSEYAWLIAFLIVGITLVPVYLLHAWWIIQIFRAPEAYSFCQCKLSQFHYDYVHRSNRFTVVIDVPELGKRVVETRAIFQTRGLVGPLTEDYVNRNVTIGYNRATETVVVIG